MRAQILEDHKNIAECKHYIQEMREKREERREERGEMDVRKERTDFARDGQILLETNKLRWGRSYQLNAQFNTHVFIPQTLHSGATRLTKRTCTRCPRRLRRCY